MQPIYKVYVTVNKVNGKVYGGKRYWYPNMIYYGSGLALKKAIVKYGIENFEVRWFKLKINTPQDLDRLEIKLIRRLRYKFGRDNCYNMNGGGRGGCYANNADERRKKEVSQLISEGKKAQYANGQTEQQLEGRKKASKALKDKFKNDPIAYNKVFVEGNKTRVESLTKRLTEFGRTEKELKHHDKLMTYSLNYVTYKLKYPDGSETIETNTLKDFQSKYNTEDNVLSQARINGVFIFKRRTSRTSHSFPLKTELHFISDQKAYELI
jgi:hypothetical protein